MASFDTTHESAKMDKKYCVSQHDICVTTNKHVNTFVATLQSSKSIKNNALQ
jgi:hypothetical protein